MYRNIYIHVPFCAKLCSYCNFSKIITTNKDQHKSYFEALKKEIQQSEFAQKEQNIATLYFGGGTPSLVDGEVLQDFFQFLRSYFIFDDDLDITFECHPNTVTEEKIKVWEEVGVTRLSLGVQSFQEKFDEFFDRDLSTVTNAIELLQNRKFLLSLDLIFGMPNQTEEDLEKDLEAIKKLNPEHISYYALDYKPNTKILGKRAEALSFETVEQYYQKIVTSLNEKKLKQYEVYNYAVSEAAQSKHNVNFWKNENYRGFGLSAVSCVNGVVQENTRNMTKYLAGEFVEDRYNFDSEELLENFIARALRLNTGVCKKDLEEKFPQFAQKVLENVEKISVISAQAGIPCIAELNEIPAFAGMTEEQYLENTKTHFYLNQKGKMYFAEVLEALLGEIES